MVIGDDIQLDVIGTLLHMRGANPTPQPLRGNLALSSVSDMVTKQKCKDNVLLWNGNIFGGELQVNKHESLASCRARRWFVIIYLTDSSM